jgi:hypothetical protein
MALSGRYGYYMDELYFRVAGEHPAWGYVDQPPLVPLLAEVQTALFGDTVVAMRVVPALLAAVSVIVCALLVRELGGDGRAQVLAVIAVATSMTTLGAGHVLHPTAVDHLVWVTVCWLVVRLLRTGDTRLWLPVGAVVGVGLLAKYLVILLVLGLAVGLLCTTSRRLLLSRYLLGGALLALVIPAGVLVWQAVNGWPQLSMASDLSNPAGVGSALGFMVQQPILVGLFLAPVWVAGIVWLLRRPPYRAIAVAYLATAAAMTVTGGFARYTEGLLTVLLAVGCVPAARWARSAIRRALLAVAAVLNAATAAMIVLPVLPIAWYGSGLAALGDAQLGQTGWRELTADVARVYHALPEQDRAHAVLYGWNYAQAGAVDRYGPEYGLPQPYSGHNSYADFGRPADDTTVVVAFGAPRAVITPLFARCDGAGELTFALPHLDQGEDVLVCRDPVRPWSELWPRMSWTGTF